MRWRGKSMFVPLHVPLPHYCSETAEDMKLYYHPGSPIIFFMQINFSLILVFESVCIESICISKIGGTMKVDIIFTARRYAQARSLLSSVRLSHWCIVFTRLNVKILSRTGSPIILVFCLPASVTNSKEPLLRVRKIHGNGKTLRFSTEIAVNH